MPGKFRVIAQVPASCAASGAIVPAALRQEWQLQMQRVLDSGQSMGAAETQRLTRDGRSEPVVIRVVDNGRGFASQETRPVEPHHGLHDMAERARLVGGKLSVNS